MAFPKLISILTFTNVAAAGQATLAHGLNLGNGNNVKPDLLLRDNADFSIVSVTTTQVTVQNDGDVQATLQLWCQHVHSVPREIGAGVDNLSPQPFIPAAGGGVITAAIDLQDEGVPVAGGPFGTINFAGAGVTAADGGGGVADVTIPGASGGVDLENGGTPLAGGPFDTLNLVGATAVDGGGGVANVTITDNIGVNLENGGTPLAGGPFDTLNLVGATAVDGGGGVANVTVSASGGVDNTPYGTALDGDKVLAPGELFQYDRPYNFGTVTFAAGSAIRPNGYPYVAQVTDFANTDGYIQFGGGDGMPTAGNGGIAGGFGDPGVGGIGGGGTHGSGIAGAMIADGDIWTVPANPNNDGPYAGTRGGAGSLGNTTGQNGGQANNVQIGAFNPLLTAGDGGSAAPNAGGTGGGITADTYNVNAGPSFQNGYDFFQFDWVTGMPGGGGGASNAEGAVAGGGGGGGSFATMASGQILNGQAGSIRNKGGNGGAGTDAGTCGGGGGWGGLLHVITGSDAVTVTGWCDVSGGTGGAGVVQNGTNGPDGLVLVRTISP